MGGTSRGALVRRRYFRRMSNGYAARIVFRGEPHLSDFARIRESVGRPRGVIVGDTGTACEIIFPFYERQCPISIRRSIGAGSGHRPQLPAHPPRAAPNLLSSPSEISHTLDLM